MKRMHTDSKQSKRKQSKKQKFLTERTEFTERFPLGANATPDCSGAPDGAF